MAGMAIGVRDGNIGAFNALIHVESVKCVDGPANRVVIKKEELAKLGWIVIEE